MNNGLSFGEKISYPHIISDEYLYSLECCGARAEMLSSLKRDRFKLYWFKNLLQFFI
jgi:hypothetical protein